MQYLKLFVHAGLNKREILHIMDIIKWFKDNNLFLNKQLIMTMISNTNINKNRNIITPYKYPHSNHQDYSKLNNYKKNYNNKVF